MPLQINNIFKDDNKVIAGREGAVEVIVKAIRIHIDDANTCEKNCETLRNIIEINVLNQKRACESGCLNTVCDVLLKYPNNEDILTSCFDIIRAIISNKELYAKYCTPQFIKVITGAVKKRNNNERLSLLVARTCLEVALNINDKNQ